MFKKGSKLRSILTGSCPRCQKESMYCDRNLLRFWNAIKMNENCSHCKLKYLIEPAFFYGAMYVSYTLNVALLIAIFLVAFFGFKANFTSAFIAMILILILLTPYILRLSRNIYINIFVSYDDRF